MTPKALQLSNQILAFLLTLLGFASDCYDGVIVDMYGAPFARYTVKGNVVSVKDNKPIGGIQIQVQSTVKSGYKSSVGTIFTDTNGFNIATIYELNVVQTTLSLSDIDGIKNGSFLPVDTLVTYVDPVFTGSKGGYDQV